MLQTLGNGCDGLFKLFCTRRPLHQHHVCYIKEPESFLMLSTAAEEATLYRYHSNTCSVVLHQL